ncbi:MAG: ATP-binding protein [Clostridia bacterium]
MKIDYLKVNGFGKLENKEIEFGKKINVIYGENEAGKTTLLKCILSMLYGVSSNKNGKDISEKEQYKPWKNAEFSGKMKYELDNGEKIEVFRDFSKRNPKITNEFSEDITNTFNIDKHTGNNFFYEQTKIDKDMLLITGLVEQKESVLEDKEQNLLTQKIANILTSGEENISYKKAIEKLNKELVEKIGNDRTTGRPINIINEKIEKLKENINKINDEEEKVSNLKQEKELVKKQIEKIENELIDLRKVKDIKLQENVEKEKLGVKKELLKEYDEKLEKLNEQAKAKDKDVQKSLNIILSVIFIVLSAITFYINKLAGLLAFGIFIAIYLPVILIRKNAKNQEEKLKQKEIKNLRKSKLEKETEIEETEKTICDNVNREIIENVNNTGLRTLDLKTVENRIAQEEQNLSNSKIHLNTIEIEEKRIGQDLEKKVEIEETLEKTLEEKNDLETEERRIKLAKEMLEQAYIKMKNEITPKFTSNLSKIASEISNNKYSNIKFNDNDGLTVELENGEYVKCDRLSTGTIEQLYLALRLSAFEEITEEKIPIILDEAFAYYDNIRLENILSYLNNYYTDNQILIFTCTDREKQILDRLKIEYNFIKL